MRIIAGKYKGRILKTGSGPGYRPATGKVRGSLFSMLEALGLVWQGARVLDVFAGSGSLGFEALSRGCLQTVFVEKSACACRILRENARLLGVQGECSVRQKDALSFLAVPAPAPFDLVFADPPYGKHLARPALELLAKDWLLPMGFLCAETEAELDLRTVVTEQFELVKDRLFGQTRIYIWQKAETGR